MRGYPVAALLFTLVAWAGPVWAGPDTAPVTQPDQRRAAIVVMSGQVNDYSRDDLMHRFQEAQTAGADTVILQINTYGGMLAAAMDISRFIKGQNLHTIAFVDDKAISAGSMIAVACNEIVMSPSSVIGDCAPIIFDTGGRLEPMPPTERAKASSPVLAEFEDSARRNGYDPRVLDAMVVVSGPLYVMEDASGQKRVVDERDYQHLTADGWKLATGVSQPVSPADRLLTVGPAAAQVLGISHGEAASAAALAGQRGYAVVADLTPGAGDHLVEMLGSTGVRFILLLVFLQSLYIAMHAPGHGAAEAMAVVSLGLLLGVPLMTGYAQWWEIVLVIAGLALCAFEVLVFPGHGVSLLLGSMMVLSGLILTFAGRIPAGVPMWEGMWRGAQRGMAVVAAALVCTAIVSFWLRRYLPRLPIFKGLILTQTSGGAATAAADLTPRGGPDTWPYAGTVGVAVTDLRPGGSARFPFGDDTRITSVVSAAGYVVAGTRLVVQEARGNRVVVRSVA